MLNLNGNMLSGNLNNNVNGYQKDIQGVSEAAAAARGELTSGRGANNSLTGLNVGDVFNGEIVDINNHNVSIKLNDDSIVNAFLKQSLEMNIGQKLLFQVKDKNDEQIFIRPMADNGVSKDLINKSLVSAGLSLNARNSAIVGALINAGQPIDRQSIIGYLKLTGEYGLANIDKLIDMNKHGISISSGNVEMYGKYSESAHRLQNILDNISEGMNEYIDNVFSGDISENLQELNEFAGMLDKLSQALDNEEMQDVPGEKNIASGGMTSGETTDIETTNVQTANANTETTNVQTANTNIETTNSKVANVNTEAANSKVANVNAEMANLESANEETINLKAANIKTANLEAVNVNAELSNLESENQQTENIESANIQDVNERFSNAKAETTELSHGQLKGKISAGEENKSVSKGTLADISKQLTDLAREKLEGKSSSESISQKLDNIRHKLQNALLERLSLNIEDFNKDGDKLKEQIDRLYDKMSKTADIIRNTITSDKGGGLSTGGEELKNNLSFMNELNHMESYIQLPLKMSMNEANGDLYVYNKRNSGKNSDEPLTAFLHLDLDGLGATDVNVSLKNSDVSVSFTLDNEQSHKLVLEHLEELAGRLEQKGYKAVIRSEYNDDEEVNDNRNALLPITGNDENATSIKRYTFDLRA